VIIVANCYRETALGQGLGLLQAADLSFHTLPDAMQNPVARELAPAGLRSDPKTNHRSHQIYGCFAPEREQAPSSQLFSVSG